jgi:hypothetical protein
MSDTVSPALTDAERTDARRFCGYPAYGTGQSGFQSWRFFTAYGTLEYRLSNLSPAELVIVRTYLSQLTSLETAVVASGDNLDTEEAAIWKRNRNEPGDRTTLFETWCRRLCGFLGVPPGPALSANTDILI